MIVSGVYCLDGLIRKGYLHGRPTLHSMAGDERMQRILAEMHTTNEPYRPTFWAHSAMAQLGLLTLWKSIHSGSLSVERHILTCADGGEVAVKEYLFEKTLPQDAPIILLLHTITGTVQDEAEFAKRAYSRGWRPILLCRRGHFSKLTTPRWNVMGDVEDTKLMVSFVHAKYPDAYLGAVGISAGSGQVVSYIGTMGEDTPVQAAVSLCPAYSIDTAFVYFQEQSPLLAKYLLGCLKSRFLTDHEHILGDQKGYTKALKSESIEEFMVNSVHMAGHDTYEGFLEASNPMELYKSNATPCLILNATDDPLCVEENIRYDIASSTENFALVITKSGSHVAYREGIFGQSSYMHRVALDFLESSMKVAKTD